MDLKGLLAAKKDAILRKWFDAVLESYPADTSNFLKTKKNRFANPVGYSLTKGLEALFDGLLQGVEIETLSPSLDSIVRIRAVQGMAPSKAMIFPFLLKNAIRGELEPELRGDRFSGEMTALESAIDALALHAFNIYMQCREKIYALQAEESQRLTYRLLQKAKMVCEVQGEDPGTGSSKDTKK
ncbi:MAG: RsbRD N-terminal domain-containing protein [Nitrospirales bacterium]|nr:RsbRD N-terminal domain-containing protein [Nitrospirales bacterium]